MNRKVKVYLSNPLGFYDAGRDYLYGKLVPRLTEMGLVVLEPFTECEKEFEPGYLKGLKSYADVLAYWRKFSKTIEPTNERLMRKAHFMAAFLDGSGPDVDSGVASEIGRYAQKKSDRRIIALRTDMRPGENPAIPVNAQVWGYIHKSGGTLIHGPGTTEQWFAEIEEWYKALVAA